MKFIGYACLVLLLISTASCTKKNEASDTPLGAEALVARGLSIYKLNCIACHNPDPTKDGINGPAVAGASKELLTARLLRAEYPAGYTPKRNSRSMPALVHLEKEIPALDSYLNSLFR